MRVQVVLVAAFLAVAELAPVEDVMMITERDIVPDTPEIPDYEIAGPSTGIFIGDVQLDPHRNSAKGRQWKNGIVPYIIYDKYPQVVKDTILASFREIEHDVNGPGKKCIQFIPKTNENYYINVMPQRGCHSQIGRGANQIVSIGRGCERQNTIMHELLHALGFMHEQVRYDRDKYIDIDFNNIEAGHAGNYKILPEAGMDTQGVDYDYISIMHYGAYIFAKDISRPVMKPKPGLDKGHGMGNIHLSTKDVLKIQRYYGCKEDTSHIITTKTPDYIVDCDFDFGLCNMNHSDSSEVQWVATSKDMGNGGPHAGHTNGGDNYLLAPAKGNKGKKARLMLPATIGPVCLDFSMYQKGPTSYFNFLAGGPNVRLQTFKSSRLKGNNFDRWMHFHLSFKFTDKVPVNTIIEANIGDEDLAIDDVRLYLGKC